MNQIVENEDYWGYKNMTLDEYCWFLAFHHLKPWKDHLNGGYSFIDCERITWAEIEIKTKAKKKEVEEYHIKRYNGLT